MRLSGCQIFWPNVNSGASYGARGGNCERQVFMFPVDGEVIFVDRPLINRVGDRKVDQFAAKRKIKNKI